MTTKPTAYEVADLDELHASAMDLVSEVERQANSKSGANVAILLAKAQRVAVALNLPPHTRPVERFWGTP